MSQHPLFEATVPVDPAMTRQVIEVTPSGKNIFKARLTAWTYDHGLWRKVFGPWPVSVGRNGFAPLHAKKEGDGKTPSGFYAVGTVFGRTENFKTGLPYRQTMDDDIWVDDAASLQYNRWVKMPTKAASYENMRRRDGLYDLGAVIEYNTDPVVPGYGSAIFMHIWRDQGRQPTAGCVALNHRRLQHLLGWLKSDAHPVIVLNP